MTTTRWLMAVVTGAWLLTGGAAIGADDPAHHAEAKARAGEHAKININEADLAGLMQLDGVGAAAAKKIIAWREAHGPFKRAADLEKVPGVGKQVLEKNHGRIAVK